MISWAGVIVALSMRWSRIEDAVKGIRDTTLAGSVKCIFSVIAYTYTTSKKP